MTTIPQHQISDVNAYMQQLGAQARKASRVLAAATTAQKNSALNAIADDLDHNRNTLIAENLKDLDAGREKGLSDALLDRLELDN